MEIMDIVKTFYKEIKFDAHINCTEKHPTANNCIECCSKPYFEKIKIDYTCPQKRKIYVARYAPAYISEIRSAFSSTPKRYIEKLIKKTEINVASIGGGPGTDIAGFKKWISRYLDEDHSINEIRFLRVDLHEDWSDISPKLINLYTTPGIDFDYKRITRDITKHPIDAESFETFDIIIMSYIISEIDPNEVVNIAKNIRKVTSKETLLVINDRPQSQVIEKIESLIRLLDGNDVKIIKATEKDHCGESYPEEIYNKVGATVFRKSVRYNTLIRK